MINDYFRLAVLPKALEQKQLSDQIIWNAIREGNKGALGELYELYYRSLYRYGFRLQPDMDFIEDTIQDLFINLWNTRQRLSNVMNIKAYLFTILRREIYRKSKQQQFIQDIDDLPGLELLEEGSEYEHEDYEKWLVLKLTEMLKNLPKRQLEIIQLRYYENLSTAEIATVMGITEKSVRNTVYKALTYMRINIHSFDYMILIFAIMQIFQYVLYQLS